MVTFGILLIVLVAIASQAHSLLIPGPDKEHKYKSVDAAFALVDKSRKDPWDGGDRKIMVTLFMPVLASSCGGDCEHEYMGRETAMISNQQFFGDKNKNVFEKVKYQACCGACQSIDASRISVVVLEPHTDTSRLLYANLARYIAANNIAVLLIDHPHDSAITEFPGAPTIFNSGATPLSNLSPITSWNDTVTRAIAIRTQDIAFALSSLASLDLKTTFPTLTFSSALDASHYAIVGHGLGGAVASSLGFSDPRVRFSINLDGTPPPLAHQIKNPTYLIGRSDATRDADVNWPTTWLRLTGPATEFDIANCSTTDFTDLPIVVDVVGNAKERAQSPWPNHALRCVVEGIVQMEVWGEAGQLRSCMRMFGESGRVVPYMARGRSVVVSEESGAVGRRGYGVGVGMAIGMGWVFGVWM